MIEDIGKPFVELSYFLESDEIRLHLIFDALGKLKKVGTEEETYKKTKEFLKKHHIEGDFKKAKTKVTVGLKYFQERITRFSDTLKVLKAARRFDPALLASEPLDEEELRAELCVLPCVRVEDLIRDYAVVRDAATVDGAESIFWWKECKVASWRDAACQVLAFSPTSAAVERYFFE